MLNNNAQFFLNKRAAGPATPVPSVKKVTVVAPIIGTSQQGKSTLIKFLHEYANQPIDASANFIIGNGLTSATQNVRRYSLRIPRREVLLRRANNANNNNNAKPSMSRWTAAATADKEAQLKAKRMDRMDRMDRRNLNLKRDNLNTFMTYDIPVEDQEQVDEDLFARAAEVYEEGDSLEVLKAKLESLRLANKEESIRRKHESSSFATSSSFKTNTKADNEVLRLAKETLAMDAQEAEVEGRDTDAKSLYELLAELELESEANTKKTCSSSSSTKFENMSRFGMNKTTPACAGKTDADMFGLNSTGASRFSSGSNKNGLFKSERCEFAPNNNGLEHQFEEAEEEEQQCFESLADKIEDLLEDRTLELEMTQVCAEDEPRLVLDVIDTPGLLDSASLVDPMIDLEHLAMTLDKVRESKGNTSTLVYVINANRPLDSSNLNMLKTYLSTLGDFTRNLVVVHSGFDFRRALRRTDSFGAKLNLFDLGPRATEFDRHLATTLGFPHIRAIHVPMNNDLSATMPLSPMRAGLRAMSFQAVNHFIDVLEQLAIEVPAPMFAETSTLMSLTNNKMPAMVPFMSTMPTRAMTMDVTEIVKTKLVRDIDLLAESLVAKKIDMLRNDAMLARRVRDAEQLVLREQLARSGAELAAVEYAMAKLNTEDLVEFHTKIGHWNTTTTTTGDVFGNEWTTTALTQDASPFMWRMGASNWTAPSRRGLFANLHLMSTPPAPVFAKISIASTEFPIRSVREILPSGMPVAIRRRTVNPTNFELLLTTPAVMSVTSTSTPVIAKLLTFRKDMYAKELLALRERRAGLRAHMVLVRTRLTANAAEEALERQMQALYRVLEALRGERMPLDLLLATKDLYRGVSRVLVGEVQQMHQVRMVPSMMHFEAFQSVMDKKPVVVRDLDMLVGKMEKFFLGF